MPITTTVSTTITGLPQQNQGKFKKFFRQHSAKIKVGAATVFAAFLISNTSLAQESIKPAQDSIKKTESSKIRESDSIVKAQLSELTKHLSKLGRDLDDWLNSVIMDIEKKDSIIQYPDLYFRTSSAQPKLDSSLLNGAYGKEMLSEYRAAFLLTDIEKELSLRQRGALAFQKLQNMQNEFNSKFDSISYERKQLSQIEVAVATIKKVLDNFSYDTIHGPTYYAEGILKDSIDCLRSTRLLEQFCAAKGIPILEVETWQGSDGFYHHGLAAYRDSSGLNFIETTRLYGIGRQSTESNATRYFDSTYTSGVEQLKDRVVKHAKDERIFIGVYSLNSDEKWFRKNILKSKCKCFVTNLGNCDPWNVVYHRKKISAILSDMKEDSCIGISKSPIYPSMDYYGRAPIFPFSFYHGRLHRLYSDDGIALNLEQKGDSVYVYRISYTSFRNINSILVGDDPNLSHMIKDYDERIASAKARYIATYMFVSPKDCSEVFGNGYIIYENGGTISK